MRTIQKRNIVISTVVGTLSLLPCILCAQNPVPLPTPFSIDAKGVQIHFDFCQGKYLRLINMLPEGVRLEDVSSTKQRRADKDVASDNEVLFQVTGDSQVAHHGMKFIGGSPGTQLEFIEKLEQDTPHGKRIVIVQKDPKNKLRVESYYEINDFSPVIRRHTRVTNQGDADVGIDYLSSATLNNYAKIEAGGVQEDILISYAFNSWKQEAQWKTVTAWELGWLDNGGFNFNAASIGNVGSWSTIRYLPLGVLQNVKSGITWFWQIEHNGTWHWEGSNTQGRKNYLYLGGPDALHGEAWKNLKLGETYETVPVALGCVRGGFNEAIAAMTQYRRNGLLKKDSFTRDCPVIFNDYMNCLSGQPTTEKELPLIDAAAKAGCNYYVIDAGWYAELTETWWDSVGAWEASKTRFPDGLPDLMGKIKSKGMIPGLWVEPEVVGIKSPLKDKPDNWFLMRGGKRIIDNSRYMLDFRNPEVRKHMTSVIDRLVKTYGIGYFKFDYNNSAWGTTLNAESAGQGLLEHNRAVVSWLTEIRSLYPDVVIENCGSGGCRMDYAMLSQAQIQSSSDQQDYKKYPGILVGELAAVLPEQLGIWSYPSVKGDAKEAAFNMVSAMAGRIHLSGLLSQLSKEALDQVHSGIQIYKSKLAPAIPESIPFFPLGLPSIADNHSPIAVGLRNENKDFLFVWRLKGEQSVHLPIAKNSRIKLIYPSSPGIVAEKNGDVLNVTFPSEYMGAIVEVDNSGPQ